MTTQIVPYEVRGVPVAGTLAEQGKLNDEQRALILDQIGRDVPEHDVRLFFWTCERYGLNPFGVAQIYGIPRNVKVTDARGQERWEKRLTIQVGINGLVLIAERSGKYQGMTAPEWCGVPKDPDDEPRWRSAWLYDGPPAAARVGVWRAGAREPTWGVAMWREYAEERKDKQGKPYLVGLWATKPAMMLAKCATALALRRSFQQEFAELRAAFDPAADERPTLRARVTDLYEPPPEEPPALAAEPARPRPRPDRPASAMAQASVSPANPAARVTEAQMKAIHAIAKDKLGWEHEELTALCRYVVTGLPSMSDLTRDQAADLIGLLQGTDSERLLAMLAEAFEAAEAAVEPPLFPEHAPEDPPADPEPGLPGFEQRAYHDDARSSRR